jgi:putative ABC transport system permease protein
MSIIRQLLRRLRLLLLGRRRFERDLDDELRFHQEMQARQQEARGLSPQEARRQVQRTFGSVARYKDEVRDARGLTLVDDVARDVRLALRSLARTPGFTAAALLTFALGIGANTAVFSVVNAVLLRPLPYAEPERLVRVYEAMKRTPDNGWSVSLPNLIDWRAQSTSFERLAAFATIGAVLDGDAGAEQVDAAVVEPELFATLGVRPLLGRTFTPEEGVEGGANAVVLGEGLWRRRYGADPAIVGTSIRLEGEPYLVAGVLPAEVRFPAGSSQPAELYLPLRAPAQPAPNQRGNHGLSVIGRLKPGVTAEQANHEMRTIAARLEREYPAFQAERTALVRPMSETVTGRVRPILLLLMGAVGLVLLIACANVASLLVARAMARGRDVAVRVALGAQRGQLLRQYLTESLILAGGGAVLGVLGAHWGVRALTAMSERALPLAEPPTLDGRALLVLGAVTVLCGVAFGLAPALQVAGGRVREAMMGSGRSTATGEQQRLRSGLVVAQIALALVLLVGAGVLMRGFLVLQRNETGLEAERVLTAQLVVPSHLLGPGLNTAVIAPLLEQARAIPGVQAVGLTSMLPMDQSGTNGDYWIDDRPWPAAGTRPLAELRVVSPGYFAALGVPVLAGREFTTADDSLRPPRVIVNQAVVDRVLKGERPIGRHILRGDETASQAYEIVGVVGNVRQTALDEPPAEEIYFAATDARTGWWLQTPTLVVKSSLPESAVAGLVRSTVRQAAPAVAIEAMRSMEEVIDRSVARRRLTVWLLGVFAAIAVLLTATGLYGVISHIVTQRTREIGIRMALGAERGRVVRLVLRQGLRLAAVGVVLGLGGAWALARFLESMVYGVSVHDPIIFATVPLLVTGVTVAASLVPALRGSRVDPMVVLRTD